MSGAELKQTGKPVSFFVGHAAGESVQTDTPNLCVVPTRTSTGMGGFAIAGYREFEGPQEPVVAAFVNETENGVELDVVSCDEAQTYSAEAVETLADTVQAVAMREFFDTSIPSTRNNESLTLMPSVEMVEDDQFMQAA